MILNNLKGINLPSKKDEEFSKINFDELFSYDFKNVEEYEFDIMGLKTIEDNTNYNSFLFDITRNFDTKQKIININTNIKEPIFIIHKLEDDETFYTNSLQINVKEGIKATFVEVFVNKSKNSAYSVNRTINLEKNANLEYVRIQDINESNALLFNLNLKQEENSKLNITNFEFGSGFIVNSFLNTIDEQNVDYKLNSLVKLEDSSKISNLVRTIHNSQHSISDINFKHSLKDKARAVFKVKSIVNKTALFTKAFQNSNTILLSNDAVIYAQPHLEILIDELEASHGATSGTLDKDQLLYLRARGIPKDKAYDMLLEAFEKVLYDKIEDEQIREFVNEYKRINYV